MKFTGILSACIATISLSGFTGCQPTNDHSTLSENHHHHQPDAPAVHGMLVFGTKSLWLSHLPMFHQPHDYQVIMQVTLQKDGVDLLPAYLEDRAQSGAVYYTFVPKRFSMTHLVSGQLTSIEGTLVRGHFERGGEPIAEKVLAIINSVPVKKRFVAGAAKPATASYYVLGDQEESWLAHTIVAKPNEYDQIIAGQLNGEFWISNVSGAAVSTGLINTPDLRLAAGLDIPANDAAGLPVTITTGAELYIETGDLAL